MRNLRFLSYFLVVVAALSLAACKKDNASVPPQQQPEPATVMADCYQVKNRPVKTFTWEYTPGKFRNATLEWNSQGRLKSIHVKNNEDEGTVYRVAYLKDSLVLDMKIYNASEEVNILTPVSLQDGCARNFWGLTSPEFPVYELLGQYTFDNGHLIAKQFVGEEAPQTYVWKNACLVSSARPDGDTWYYEYTDKPAKGGIVAFLIDGLGADSFAANYLCGFAGIANLPAKVEFQAGGSTERRTELTFTYETDADGFVTGMTYHSRTLGFDPAWTFTY